MFSKLRFSRTLQALFFRRVSLLLHAGYSLPQALAIVVEREHKVARMQVYRHIAQVVSDGGHLCDVCQTLSVEPSIVQLVSAGERSGTLSSTLAIAAQEITARSTLKKKVVGACIYPLVIIGATVVLSLFLTVYLFPKLTPLLHSMHTRLPLSTRILIAASDFLIHQWYILIVALGVGVCIIVFMRTIPVIARMYDWMFLRLPLFGMLLRAYELSSVFRSVATLLHSGVTLPDTIQMLGKTASYAEYRDTLSATALKVTKGARFSDVLGEYPAQYPDTVIDLVSAGEHSGHLAESARQVANYYEQEVNERTQTLSVLLEPVLMIVMGTIVATIALSIIAPIYQLTQSVQMH